jgi:hypothetical protein
MDNIHNFDLCLFLGSAKFKYLIILTLGDEEVKNLWISSLLIPVTCVTVYCLDCSLNNQDRNLRHTGGYGKLYTLGLLGEMFNIVVEYF